MDEARIISGNTSQEVWQQIEQDLNENPDLFEYNVVLEERGRLVSLDIDIDLGGGFEGGYALTRFVANLKSFDDLHFSLHRQDFIDGIGKVFGSQDVKLGYDDFDKQIVVKTNHPDRLKDIFSDVAIRKAMLSLPEFNFHIGHHHSSNTEVESAFLELRIDEGITNPHKLRDIYNAFILVLDKVDLNNKSIIKYL